MTRIVVMAVVAVSMFGFSFANADSKSSDLLWKARGLQAWERLEALAKIKEPKQNEHCEFMLERAYAGFAHPDTSKIVTRPNGNDGGINRILLFSAKDGPAVQIAFSYDKKADSPSMIQIKQLEIGWTIAPMPEFPENLVMTDGKCSFLFDRKKPFEVSLLNK